MDVRTIVVRFLCAAAGACALACGATSTAPSNDNLLRLTATISQSVIARDSSATLTFTLENVGRETITLTFPSSCQINPYVVEGRSGRIVVPAGGGWVCATVITTLQLVPGAAAAHIIQVHGMGAAGPIPTTLPAGEYSAYATLDATNVRVRSAAVLFVVE